MKRAFDLLTSRAASLLRLGLARRPAARLAPPPPSHDLTLYEYEASPWCRLVREHTTHLGLSVTVKPAPRETLLAEGAFSKASRYRGEALGWLHASDGVVQEDGGFGSDGLQFPILVDATGASTNGALDGAAPGVAPVVLSESKAIISHLWRKYGDGVVRPPMDKILSGERLPFVVRFASLAGPSGMRPFPSCGLLRTPSAFDSATHRPLELYQAEHCPESRLVREKLSSMEIACVYHNERVRFRASGGSSHNGSSGGGADGSNSNNDVTPVLLDPNCLMTLGGERVGEEFCGSAAALSHIDAMYGTGLPAASLQSPVPSPNLGRDGHFFAGAQRAMEAGGSGFLPPEL